MFRSVSDENIYDLRLNLSDLFEKKNIKNGNLLEMSGELLSGLLILNLVQIPQS